MVPISWPSPAPLSPEVTRSLRTFACQFSPGSMATSVSFTPNTRSTSAPTPLITRSSGKYDATAAASSSQAFALALPMR